MSVKHIVKQGECIASLAHRYHIPRRVLWEAPENKDLWALRGDPYVLPPGDEVVVPDFPTKEIAVGTNHVHTFKVRQEKVHVRLRILEGGKPLEHEPYRFAVGRSEREGKTNTDGQLDEEIAAHVGEVRIEIGGRTLLLKLGHLDPVTDPTGIQARLNNLGFAIGPTDGVVGPMTRGALRQFQQDEKLKVTGEPETPTRDKLKERHGS